MEKETYSRYEKFIIGPTIEECKAFYYAEKILEDPAEITIEGQLCFTIIPHEMPYFVKIGLSSDELQTLPSLKIFKRISNDSSKLLIVNAILSHEGEIHLTKLIADNVQKHQKETRNEFCEFVDEL